MADEIPERVARRTVSAKGSVIKKPVAAASKNLEKLTPIIIKQIKDKYSELLDLNGEADVMANWLDTTAKETSIELTQLKKAGRADAATFRHLLLALKQGGHK